jgi:agmatine deiminase
MTRPADDGFRLTADWAPHSRCWMAWPVRSEAWGDHMGAAREAVGEVAAAIARFEPVTMIAKPTKVAEVSLLTASGVASFSLPQDDSWLRDFGPSFVVSGSGHVAGVHWRWNAWGGRYTEIDGDIQIPERLLEQLSMRRYPAPLVLEGSAVMTDGEGTLIASERILLDPKRNPGLERAEADNILKQYLGVERVIWIAAALEGDPAGGRLDTMLCFVKPGVVLAQTTPDKNDANAAAFADTAERLKGATDAKGRLLQLVEIEQPRPRSSDEGKRLPLAYTSLYLANGGVIIPAFEAPQDDRAFAAIAKLFPDRQPVQLLASDIVYGGGGFRPMTLPQPAGLPAG